MLHRVLSLLAVLVAVLAGAGAAKAERRVALVVGNAHYAHANALRNPANDAADVGILLKKLGFEVVVSTDVDQQEFARKIDEFGRRLEGADVGLFFYAGHGLQMNGKNYLVSTQAKLESEFLIPAETVQLDAILQLMESRARVNIVFLDACRNNPLADKLRQNLVAENRSVMLGRGLARIEPTGHDTLIAYAAAPGQEAADGRGRNSPFTSALLEHLPEPGVEVSVMLKQVAAEVRKETHGEQRPQQLSDMTRVFYFAKAEPAAKPEPAPEPKIAEAKPDHSVELAYWDSARSVNNCQSVRAYLERFPHGIFVDLAKLSESRLCEASRKVTVTDAAPAAPVPSNPEPSKPQPPIGLTGPATPPAQVKTVALPPQPEPNSAAAKVADPADLARELQRELARVGCSAGRPDGLWGSHSREALRAFSKNAHVQFAADAPTEEALVAVRRHHKRVCPVEAERSRPRPEPERARVREHSPRPTASRVQRDSTPVLGDWHKISPACTSPTYVGGRMCCNSDPEFGAPRIICP